MVGDNMKRILNKYMIVLLIITLLLFAAGFAYGYFSYDCGDFLCISSPAGDGVVNVIILAIISGESKKVYSYFIREDKSVIIHGTFYGLAFYLSISCICCAILSSSFFLSNEKNTSLMTNLIVNTKTVFISIFLHIYDRKRNKLSTLIFTGLIMTTFGAIFINAESLCNNLIFNLKKEKQKNKESEKKPEETELIDVKDESSKN